MNRALRLCLLALPALSGCAKTPEAVEPSSNPEVEVSRLMEYDGCTIYRFNDAGRYHYFARCGSEVTTLSGQSKTCGKGCVQLYDESITTGGQQP